MYLLAIINTTINVLTHINLMMKQFHHRYLYFNMLLSQI